MSSEARALIPQWVRCAGLPAAWHGGPWLPRRITPCGRLGHAAAPATASRSMPPARITLQFQPTAPGLERDAQALVLDYSFRGDAVEELARRLPCTVERHPGFAWRRMPCASTLTTGRRVRCAGHADRKVRCAEPGHHRGRPGLRRLRYAAAQEGVALRCALWGPVAGAFALKHNRRRFKGRPIPVPHLPQHVLQPQPSTSTLMSEYLSS